MRTGNIHKCRRAVQLFIKHIWYFKSHACVIVTFIYFLLNCAWNKNILALSAVTVTYGWRCIFHSRRVRHGWLTVQRIKTWKCFDVKICCSSTPIFHNWPLLVCPYWVHKLTHLLTFTSFTTDQDFYKYNPLVTLSNKIHNTCSMETRRPSVRTISLISHRTPSSVLFNIITLRKWKNKLT